MANAKNTFTGTVTDKRTIPYNVTKQGTINTVGKNVQGSDLLIYDTLVGAFEIGETVTGGTSGATGVVYADNGTTTLKISSIVGVFQNNETLTGSESGATALVDGTQTYTLFTQQCVVGDFIYNATQSEVHKIVSIESDLSMQIQEAFGSDLVAQSLIVSPCSPHPREISVLIPTGNPSGLLDGQTITAGIAWTASKMNQYNSGIGSFIDPIVVDATGTTMTVTINY